MTKTFLLLDVPYLASRHFYAMKHVPKRHLQMELLHSLLRDVLAFQDRFETPYVAYCFDRGESLRKTIYPEYKKSRATAYEGMGEDDVSRKAILSLVVKCLRTTWLRSLGYQNVFSQLGYEADDIIASLCHHSLKGDKAIIVSSDHDFFQLLTPEVSIFNPVKQFHMSFSYFRKEYEIEPEQWPMVKAIAGCKSDDVAGIKGIGEKTAIKFVHGSCTLAQNEKIMNGLSMWKKNIDIVKLPYPDVQKFRLQKDTVTRASWRAFAKSIDHKDLLSLSPR